MCNYFQLVCFYFECTCGSEPPWSNPPWDGPHRLGGLVSQSPVSLSISRSEVKINHHDASSSWPAGGSGWCWTFLQRLFQQGFFLCVAVPLFLLPPVGNSSSENHMDIFFFFCGADDAGTDLWPLKWRGSVVCEQSPATILYQCTPHPAPPPHLSVQSRLLFVSLSS